MSALEDLRASQDRDLRRVGVPMIVALRDEVPGPGGTDAAVPVDTDAPDSGDGRRLADRLDALRAELAAGQRDGDMGVVASLLTVAAHLDFGGADAVGS